MTRSSYSIVAVTFVLLLALLIPGASASNSTQPGYIVVGLAPVAQFDAHYAFSTIPTKVTFVDNSLGSTPMSYQWDFGDGASSNDQNPSHNYIQRGTYTVSLTVKNAYGSSTAIKNNFITIGIAPRADFSAGPTTGDSPLSVKFNDQSYGQVTLWSWDFGDGTRSSEQNPVHTYFNGGVYNVILTVSNAFGSSDTTKTNYITALGALAARFSAKPPTGTAPLTVHFTDLSLGNPTAWNWNFGDGSTSSDQNPTHEFVLPGSYDVRLTVTRDTDTDVSEQVVNAGGVPNADFEGAPLSVNVGDPVTFTDKTTNAPTSWSWNFGDTATSDLKNPSHTYQTKGIYTVTLTAGNLNGRGTKVRQNYINVGVPPQADFIPIVIPYQKNQVPMGVHFIDQSTGIPTSWLWDFGDGQTSGEQNPKHLYTSAGVYTVKLTAKNNFGQDSRVRADLITVGNTPAVDFAADKTTVGVGRVITFTDLSANSPTNWVWDFGDGTTGTGPKPDHAYRAVGTYDVTLTASNPDQVNSRTKNQYITVLNIPRAMFVADKTRGSAPVTVNFVDQSTGSPTSWFWNFGDGATSTEKNPAHQYMTLGTFTVALTVSNENGQDTATKTNMIETTLAPVAEFKADAQIGKAPFIVQFTDLSKGNPTSWNWEFGDGTSSSEQNPRHVYPNEGAYDVRLTVANQYGSDTIFKTGAPVQVTTAPVTTAAPVTRQTTTIVTTAPTLIPTNQSPLSPFAAMLALIFGLVVMAVNRK